MVFDDSPVIVLVKEPPPAPSEVFEFAVVGLTDVLQQIPRTVTDAAQSPVILPPDVAPDDVIRVTVVVVTEGRTAAVVKVTSEP